VNELPNKAPLREQFRRAWKRLRGGKLTPARAFWSVALGLFVGVQPTPGLHLPVVLAVCVPLRLDGALGYLATNISIPPVAPFLWLAALQTGERILTGRFAPLTKEGMRALIRAPGPLLGALVLGSIVLGALLGLVGGSLAYVTVLHRSSGTPEEPRRHRRRPSFPE
jgi:uncharacterized protein (DUF2062 family)